MAATGRPVAIIARSVHGLEWVCAWEACAGGVAASDVRLSRRQADFEIESVGPSLLGLRTADDVFVKVADIYGVGRTKAGLPALGQAAAALDWPRAFGILRAVREVAERGSFDVVASVEGRPSYNRFAVEQSIGRAVAPVLGATFSERDGGARAGAESDFTVRAFVSDDRATIAIRLGARPLHRRAYKVSTGPATLHPPVAAALAAIGAPATGRLLDPFCGDGTIGIEAALTHRRLSVLATDIDPRRVRNARQNAALAGVDIEVRLADAAAVAESSAAVDAVITNPPWNQTVSPAGRMAGSGRSFWDVLAPVLGPDGTMCCVTDADLGVPGMMARQGWQLGLAQRIRLAGRVADVTQAAPPGRPAPGLPAGLADWRRKALAAGVVTDAGF